MNYIVVRGKFFIRNVTNKKIIMTPTQQRMRSPHKGPKMTESGAIGTLGHLMNGAWLVKVKGVVHKTHDFGSGKNQTLEPLRRAAGGGWEIDPDARSFSAFNIPVSHY